MPLTPRQLRENLARRFAETHEEDERVLEALGPRRIVLYGSLATGLFLAAGSDVDLAVEGLGDEAPTRWLRRSGASSGAEWISAIPNG